MTNPSVEHGKRPVEKGFPTRSACGNDIHSVSCHSGLSGIFLFMHLSLKGSKHEEIFLLIYPEAML